MLVNFGCREKKEHFVSMKLIESYSFAELVASIDSANKILAGEVSAPYSDSANPDLETYEKNNPIYAILTPNLQMHGDGLYYAGITSDIGYIYAKDTAQLLSYLNDSRVAAILPQDLQIIFSQNVQDKLSAYAIHNDAAIQQLDAGKVKHFEFQGTGIGGILGSSLNNEESLFFIHLTDDFTDKLHESKPYTLLLEIDTTSYVGSYIRSNPPSAANMNFISKQDKESLEEMFGGQIIDN